MDRQSLFHPTRRERIREKQGIATEHGAPHGPRTTGPVDLEDVRHLVRDHHPQPLIMKAQFAQRDGRNGVDHDPIGGKHLSVAVTGVHVIGNEQVHRTRRRRQLALELRVCRLREKRRTPRQHFLIRTEMHAEVRHRDRTHRPARIHLR